MTLRSRKCYCSRAERQKAPTKADMSVLPEQCLAVEFRIALLESAAIGVDEKERVASRHLT